MTTSQVFWDNAEQTILRQIYTESLTVAEFQAIALATETFMNSVQHPVHLIIELPLNINVFTSMLSQTRFLDAHTSPNRGLSILISQSKAMNALVRTGKILAPKALSTLYQVATLAEAYQIIQQQPR
jgi:hypothetical protein